MSIRFSAVFLTVAVCVSLKYSAGDSEFEVCEDSDPDCPFYAEYCDMSVAESFVNNNCPKTCGFCIETQTESNDVCTDEDPDCPTKPYICKLKEYRAYVEQSCRKTCELCD
ncbi:uncharacterized protein [Antedon mediterranea]|uniref:uncharacterized protein n=1 Tax=Antedon mediterranea TaxID=105859 RepID=UPI003AF99FED